MSIINKSPQIIKETIVFEDGRSITIETGELARQADGAVLLRMGGTALLATVVVEKEIKKEVSFFPLQVDYREKFAAAGKIPGGFSKREGRPSDEEILIMRLVDRALRPIFPEGFYQEVQVMISLLSYDKQVLPDALAGLAASAAICVSGIPFEGPISEVRVIKREDKFIINPTAEELKEADMDLMVAASEDSIIMVEGEMKEVGEAEMIQAIKQAHLEIKKQIKAQSILATKASVVKQTFKNEFKDEVLFSKIRDFSLDAIFSILNKKSPKKERNEALKELFLKLKEHFSIEEFTEKQMLIEHGFEQIKKECIRKLILEKDYRLDGRSPQEIRPIWAKVDYLSQVHGSALFTRGETQSLTTVTLGSSLDANRVDTVVKETAERFFLHYNFPPFSTSEVRPTRGVSRREIGHGNLAQRALKGIVPDDMPYTIRIVSDILESNGSSSMATVCAGTLALMDAGISISSPVSGIAMGLVSDSKGENYKILSDILGDEDHIGDMDFKVAGTARGITACQMDIKIKGLSYDILEKALEQARKGRLYILDRMLETLDTPRTKLKASAPKIHILKIAKETIGAVIGPGGKVIQKIQADTNTTITIEEVEDHEGSDGIVGKVEILSKEYDQIEMAVDRIKKITSIFSTPPEAQLNKLYKAKVKFLKKDIGAIVKTQEGIEGLLHISEIQKKEELGKGELSLNEGDELEVICKRIRRDSNNKLRISFSLPI